MMKQVRYAVISLLSFLFCACSGTSSDKHQVIAVDTVKVAEPQKKKPVLPPVNKKLDELARFMAGLDPLWENQLDSSLRALATWKSFSANLNKNWQKLDSTKLAKMRVWANVELSKIGENTIFYPFAGADALNVYTFFPKAKTYIMIGLEPVGSLPVFGTSTNTDLVSAYFNEINQSLYSILNFSFFRTIAMASDFHKAEVNGTLHVNMLFLERTGNRMVSVTPVNLNTDGTVKEYITFNDMASDSLLSKGVKIDFLSADSLLHTLYYFSCNLANDGLSRNKPLLRFVEQYGALDTYIKSASYLMHRDQFSMVREFILSKSDAVLQDDSGIPYKFFTNSSAWKNTLYGVYTGVIPLFAGLQQPDLKAAFTDTTNRKPLPFGIGYKYRLGESNLMLSKKMH